MAIIIILITMALLILSLRIETPKFVKATPRGRGTYLLERGKKKWVVKIESKECLWEKRITCEERNAIAEAMVDEALTEMRRNLAEAREETKRLPLSKREEKILAGETMLQGTEKCR